jgi:hypothetical protein
MLQRRMPERERLLPDQAIQNEFLSLSAEFRA